MRTYREVYRLNERREMGGTLKRKRKLKCPLIRKKSAMRLVINI